MNRGLPFSDQIAIQLHPSAVSFDFLGHVKLAKDLKTPLLNITEAKLSISMSSQRSEFLTDPPISTLAFQLAGPPSTLREQQICAVLRNSKGSGAIRLGDFLDMCERMRVYEARLNAGQNRSVPQRATTTPVRHSGFFMSPPISLVSIKYYPESIVAMLRIAASSMD